MRPFEYRRVGDVGAATRAMGVEARLLAGGTTLLDLMKLDVLRPTFLVDANDLDADLGGIESTASELRLGSFARMAAVAANPDVARDYPVIAESLLLAASPQIRNMATLGGNVLQRTRCSYYRDRATIECNRRDPGSGCAARVGSHRKHAILGTSEACIATYPGDFAQALVALRARVDIEGPRGGRTIPFASLHRLPGSTPDVETTLEPDEVLTRFIIPAGPWTRRSSYLKIRDRESYEFALASAAVALAIEAGVVGQARIALGGVATIPWQSKEAEAALVGRPLDEETARGAADAAFAGAEAGRDNHYKIELGKRTLVRALLEVAAREVSS